MSCFQLKTKGHPYHLRSSAWVEILLLIPILIR